MRSGHVGTIMAASPTHPIFPQYRYLNEGCFGPLLSISVGTSALPCSFGRPCSLFRLRLSYRMYMPKEKASTPVKPPKAADVASAGMYLGASLAWWEY